MAIMLTVEEAQARILAEIEPLGIERVPLAEALGRTLAADITADIDLPPYDNSAVDGYAVRAIDTVGATPDQPVILTTLADIPAGEPAREVVTAGRAARIMTGAQVPSGADAVVMVEDTRREPDGVVAILEAARPEQHVRRAGEDVRQGVTVLSAGVPLRPAEIGLLATVGRALTPVYRRARVAVLSTGDEVVEVQEGILPPPGKIRNSNLPVLAALVREAGAELHSARHLPDDLEAIVNAFRACADPKTGADVIVTAGGVSMGDRDYVKPALERLGRLDMWRVSMKPGKPLVHGRIGRTRFFGLPGNPVSSLVTFEMFVRPTLWRLAGVSPDRLARPQVRAEVLEPVNHTPGRREYVRAITVSEDGRFVTRPTGGQGSGNLHTLALANSLLIVPDASPGLQPGDRADVILL
jgi:molybdopterin molybdotransferase